jgi:hypothetical protein
MKRGMTAAIGVGALVFVTLVGFVWVPPAFAPTAVEYIAGPFSVNAGQTVRVTLFNVRDSSQLVVIALVDITDGTVVGVTKSLTLDPRKGTIQDFLMEEEGILIGLLRTTPPRQPGGRDLRPGATLHVIDGNSIFTDKYGFIGTDVTG